MCHLGAAASFPWHQGCSLSSLGTRMCHGHPGSAAVSCSSVGGNKRSIHVLHSSVFPNCSYLLPTSFIQFIMFSSLSSFLFLPQSSNLSASISLFALRYFLFWMLGHGCPRHNKAAHHFSCCQEN